MFNNAFLDLEPPINELDLDQLEKEYSFSMPTMIRNHILEYNGGYPKKSVFVNDDGETYSVSYFIPVKYGNFNLEKVLDLLRDDKVFPKWLVPFADDDGGDFFCYSLRNDEIGAIYYYSHEFDYGEDPEQHITYLSPSINDFIDSLIEDDDEYEDDID